METQLLKQPELHLLIFPVIFVSVKCRANCRLPKTELLRVLLSSREHGISWLKGRMLVLTVIHRVLVPFLPSLSRFSLAGLAAVR